MFIATHNAIYAVEDNGNGEPTQIYNGTGHQGLNGSGNHDAMVSLSNGQAVLSTLSDGTLLFLSEDGEKRIPTGIEDPIASLLVVREDPLTLLIGTDEGAYVYRLVGEDGPAERVIAFDELECRKDWYTPWGGPPAVRTLAKTQDGFCYADVHVGSIMRSADEGISWEPVTPELHKDVHQVTTCPADDNRVYANTQNGVYVSTDRGHSWEHRIEGLPRRYGTAIAVHPTEPDLLIATVQNGPRGGGAWLCRSENGGTTWTQLNNQLTEPTDRIRTGYIAFTADGTAWAVIGKTLYIGKDRATDWSPFWTPPEHEASSDEYPIQSLAV
ncbi:hypothetical protein F4054_05950 [Candidatus Poribacteria bacterium]|nr:hypothetical protein [Candidatus Poribacteria bacterium]MYG08220.1 hypothetical protein [Candidatus Poribacteria bacterium]MYK21787.1 hypothetical protein [Candidatus Poribacteria bacterium]